MEIVQRWPNRAEKRGRLNLIDLAGSEKVGKSGASGDTLEEAKKINLSLSCLGNVIHALTTNHDHIPYRDSKLTRILQESLGGNFKTSLIVTCSPHSSNKEETISTLKFATRAKTIKTHYKMNIQNSPDSMMNVIERLKLELDGARNELARFKNGEYTIKSLDDDESAEIKRVSIFKPPEFSWRNSVGSSGSKALHDESHSPHHHEKTPKSLGLNLKFEKVRSSSISEGFRNENNESQALFKLNMLAANGSFKKDKIDDLPEISTTRGSSSKEHLEKRSYNNQYGYFKSNLELISENQILEMRNRGLKEEVGKLKTKITEKDQLLKIQDEQILHQRNEILQLENKLNFMVEQRDFASVKLDQKINSTDYLNNRAQVLENQIKSLSEALMNCEQSIQKILEDKFKLSKIILKFRKS